ncbi:ABC transporter related [Beutenbergia cavernae DSM 12333]|uniref:ABC transporter related n=1 Tax=Beutenbergia cavernae (strain ATCC BAA-8 / DSM 12333 / CCUG 43141 / JCM 11478 / NBRC 16432 / NCIMB 13614 / HKI 0122) TaxID=471853 RepID=C5BZ25_BEUC1|nr:ATP-binding cassette domain-containing protein [Beutenbergia cavernae]ACQ81140.1 ABC transporter related [Beutenbergia cavernae DSM 12333]
MADASTEWAVQTRELRKTYLTRRGRRVAVDGLDLRVPVGGVHGFLGPNGSGKTTTIRMLLGLARADSGRMRIFGRPVPHELPDVVSRVGAIVESPKFFPSFTGAKNLSLLAEAIDVGRARVETVLGQTGLTDRAGDRYKTYSLGMKQRLAIAATLLKEPDLLIFDEPTNGLDPAGIHEIRATMRRLADEGRTVLVSSHILAEVEQVADTVSIIGRGRLLASGTVEAIVGQRTAAVRVGIADPGAARDVLTASGLAVRDDDGHLVVDGEADPARITYLLATHGLYVHELTRVRAGLESVFLDLTREEHLGAQGDVGEEPATTAGVAR